MIAIYDGRCTYCGSRIVANVSHIRKVYGDWVHERCGRMIRREKSPAELVLRLPNS
jgi:hypothetical protein